jgi:ribosomal-protein-alanine N-acetyltransferase
VISLETPRLKLDAVTAANAAVLWRVMQGAHLREFQDIPRFTRDEFERRVAQRPKQFHPRAIGRFEWLVSLADSRRPIGWVSLRVSEEMRGAAEAGYSLLAPYRGHGYATEAVGAMVDAAFRESDLSRVDACCVPENATSRRVLERLGFREGKVQKSGAVVRGHAVDIVVYEFKREQWQAQAGSANSMVIPASPKLK